MSDHSSVSDDVPGPDRIVTQQDFGRALTLLRNRAGLTVRQVARASGLPASTVGDYFSGRHLPSTGQAGSLLRILTACGETDPARLRSWTHALGRARRQPARRMALRAGGDAPYRGLASFEREDAPWFFGREKVIQRLFELDRGASLPLIVVGPSGSGKSSLLRAGLMAQLTGPVALFVPTATPAADFAAVVASLPASSGVAGASGSLGSKPRYVIVDQFEAVFTRCQDEEQRQAFIRVVGDLAETATVILALRADFYDQALRYPVLAAALQARQVVLGPMTADQVRRAIVEPARRAHLEVEDGLVELLLRDLDPRTPNAQKPGAAEQGAHEPGALPLLLVLAPGEDRLELVHDHAPRLGPQSPGSCRQAGHHGGEIRRGRGRGHEQGHRPGELRHQPGPKQRGFPGTRRSDHDQRQAGTEVELEQALDHLLPAEEPGCVLALEAGQTAVRHVPADPKRHPPAWLTPDPAQGVRPCREPRRIGLPADGQDPVQ